MADPHVDRDSGDDSGARPRRRPPGGAPRWVWALGIVVAIGLLALLVALHLSGTLGPGAHR